MEKGIVIKDEIDVYCSSENKTSSSGSERDLELDLIKCTHIWKSLKHWAYKPFAYPFYKPVDPIELNIPDYHDIITSPMDLSTIKKKIDDKCYSHVLECLTDFNSIFENCYAYNSPELEVHQMAKRLQKIYFKKVEEWFPDLIDLIRKQEATQTFIAASDMVEEKIKEQMSATPERLPTDAELLPSPFTEVLKDLKKTARTSIENILSMKKIEGDKIYEDYCSSLKKLQLEAAKEIHDVTEDFASDVLKVVSGIENTDLNSYI